METGVDHWLMGKLLMMDKGMNLTNFACALPDDQVNLRCRTFESQCLQFRVTYDRNCQLYSVGMGSAVFGAKKLNFTKVTRTTCVCDIIISICIKYHQVLLLSWFFSGVDPISLQTYHISSRSRRSPPQMFSMRWGAMAPGQPNSIKREKTAKDWQLLVPKPRCSSLASCGKIGKHIFYIIFRQKWMVPCTNQTGASPKQLVRIEAGPQFHNGLGIEGIPLYNIYTYVKIINNYYIIITIINNCIQHIQFYYVCA